jgi:hypothetical protein
MVKTEYKDEIFRFILDSPEEDNEGLAAFVAGVRAQKEIFDRAKAGKPPKPGQAAIGSGGRRGKARGTSAP